ncbi:hypothetical protein EL75_4561 [Escherichia coli]|nr:hypothetical protein EL75_4561 [Escherichia coli]KGM76318.1 hypothetical protein EL79_5353 [Escherichia coli]
MFPVAETDYSVVVSQYARHPRFCMRVTEEK